MLKLTNRYYYIVIFGFLSSNVFKYHVFWNNLKYIYIYSFVDIWICIILIIYYDFIVVILLRYQ